MPDDDLEDFEGGSASFRRKANALVKHVKALEKKFGGLNASPLNLYLNTDSKPVIVQIYGRVLSTQPDTEGSVGEVDA